MRKQDIRPGVVYGYKRFGNHFVDPREPLVFLAAEVIGNGATPRDTTTGAAT